MLIQVNTDSNTHGTLELTSGVEAFIEEKLGRFAERITRVEVHLNDENSPSKAAGDDRRCMIEVRMANMDPITTTEHADTYDKALRGAANKMQDRIETILGKLGKR